jgi:hypothetical protein
MMKDDLVEAVARAICKADGYDPDRLNGGEYQWVFYTKEAIAAIEAARPFIRADALEEAEAIVNRYVGCDHIAAAIRELMEKKDD